VPRINAAARVSTFLWNRAIHSQVRLIVSPFPLSSARPRAIPIPLRGEMAPLGRARHFLGEAAIVKER